MGGHRKDKKPSREGKLKGYCSRCGMMLMVGEKTCPKPVCGCKEVTSKPPFASKLIAPKSNSIRNKV